MYTKIYFHTTYLIELSKFYNTSMALKTHKIMVTILIVCIYKDKNPGLKLSYVEACIKLRMEMIYTDIPFFTLEHNIVKLVCMTS